MTGALVALPTLFLEGGGSKTAMGGGRIVLNIPSEIIASTCPYKKPQKTLEFLPHAQITLITFLNLLTL